MKLNINLQKLGRALICLLLVCCILFNCSTVKVHALDPVTTFCLVVAAEAVISSLISLGIQKGADMAVQSELANQIVEDMTNAGAFVVNGMVQAMIVQTGTTYKSYLPYEFIEWVRNWCYENEVVTEVQASGAAIPAGTKVTWDTSNYLSASIDTTLLKSTFTTSSGYEYLCIILYSLTSSFTVSQSGSSYSSFTKTVDGVKYYYYSVNAGSFTTADTAGSFYLGTGYSISNSQMVVDTLRANTVVDPVSTTYDLTLGDVALSDEEIKDRYAEWSANAQEVEDEETGTTTTYYPVSLPDTTDQTQSQTQTEAQAGTISNELAESLTDSLEEVFDGTVAATPWSTFTSWLTKGLTGIKEAVLSIPVAITDFFTFDTSVDAWAISLKDFFPFCIPYDIYDFLSILAAEPEAPVFHWEIPVPQLDKTFEVDVDLSAWDDVARLFRSLELLAFIVGLAYVTREKFTRG